MKITKGLLQVFLVCILVVGVACLVSTETQAADYSGTCGENVTWELDIETGVLTISGTGEMKDYSNLSSYAPWYTYRENISLVRIGDGITSIGRFSFYECVKLKTISLSNDITSIGDWAFGKCTNLANIEIPSKVTSIGYGSFYECKSFTDITIPKSTTDIGDYAFRSCSNLTNITIPTGITEIGEGVFGFCSSLKEIAIPVGVTSIGDEAFSSCINLINVIIPDGVTSIGDFAFCNCPLISSIVIPKSIWFVGDNAFSMCTALADAYYNGTVSQWENIYIGSNNDKLINALNIVHDTHNKTNTEAISASCTTDGYTEGVYCNDCQMWISGHEVITAGHDWNDGENVYNLVPCQLSVLKFTCNECQTVEWREVDPSSHDYSIIGTVEPTCTEKGFTTHTCSMCRGSMYSDNFVPAKGHALEEWQIVTVPTYSDSGLRTQKCTLCGEIVNSEVLPAYDDKCHINETLWITVNSAYNQDFIINCEGAGFSYYLYWSHYAGSNTARPYQKMYAITFNDPGYWSLKINGTVSGNLTYNVWVTDHSYSDKWSIDTSPTCTMTGTKSHHCTMCDSKTDVTVIDALGHSWADNYTTDIGPSCTAVGIKSIHCNTCGVKKDNSDVEIPMTGHPCYWYHTDSMGNDAYDLMCSACNENFGRGYKNSDGYYYIYSESLKHNIYTEEGVFVNDEACAVNSLCEYDEEFHNGVCKCHAILSEDEHTFNEDVEVATCTKNGWITYTCSCGYTYTEEIPATGNHTYKTTTTKATTSKDGKIVNACTVCGDTKSSTKIYKASSFKLSTTKYTYDGKVKTPSVTVKDSKGKTLKKDTDYTVKYESGRKSVGEYTVTVTLKGNYSGTKKLTFTIVPKATSKITVSQTTSTITAKWSKVDGATGYKVYLYKGSECVASKTVSSKTLSYKFSKLSAGTKYTVKVKTYKKVDGENFWSSTKSLATATKPATPKIASVKAGTKSATIKWNNVSGENGYQVYYATSKNGTYKKGATCKANDIDATIKNLSKGKTYYFKVRAYKTTDSGTVYSDWSAVKSVKVVK